MKLSAVIVEDEPLARASLRDLLESVDWLELVGEAADGLTAVTTIDELRPDLLFLDVQLPELTGIEVLERIRHTPEVVFTTAFDSYAVTAFELEAVDYLLKPFGRRRFRQTLERLKRRLEASAGSPDLADRARSAFDRQPLRRLFARKGERVVPLAVSRIRRIEAEGDYAAVHCDGQAYLIHVTLNELESRLDPERFLRVHRSHLVNLDWVRQMRPYDERRLEIALEDGSVVVASRGGSRRLRELIR